MGLWLNWGLGCRVHTGLGLKVSGLGFGFRIKGLVLVRA